MRRDRSRRRVWAEQRRWWIVAAVCVLAFAANVLAADLHTLTWTANGTLLLEFAAIAWAIGVDKRHRR